MAEKTKKSGGVRKHVSKYVLAQMGCHKAIIESFTKAIDTYIIEHNISEEEDRWLRDFLSNAHKATEDLLRSLSKEPKRAFDKYLEEEEEEEEGSAEVPKEEDEEAGAAEESSTDASKKEGEKAGAAKESSTDASKKEGEKAGAAKESSTDASKKKSEEG